MTKKVSRKDAKRQILAFLCAFALLREIVFRLPESSTGKTVQNGF
jgi:hypothetical protein